MLKPPHRLLQRTGLRNYSPVAERVPAESPAQVLLRSSLMDLDLQILGAAGLEPAKLIPLILTAVVMYAGPALISVIWVVWLGERFGSGVSAPQPSVPTLGRVIEEMPQKILEKPEEAAPSKRRRTA